MKKIILLSILLAFTYTLTSAQQIKGYIVNELNKPIINVNIYQKDTNTGTITNKEGFFSLNINKKNKQIIIQCIGFKTQQITLSENNKDNIFNIILKEEVIVLPEFKVLANGEDPAYYIMRKVITMAPYYSQQLSKYNCKVYLKGSVALTAVPRLLRKTIEKDGVKIGKAYVTESINKVHFELPNKVTQNVIAIRSSQADEQTSPMQMIVNNLYNSDAYDVSSPLGPLAFKTYKFKLIGTFKEGKQLINKIKITPRGGKTKGVFKGYIYIIENKWSLHSVDLSTRIMMIDAKMKQLYGFIEKGIWMPKTFSFDIKGGAMGFKFEGKYTASLSDYQVTKNPSINHTLLAKINGNTKDIDKSINQKDTEQKKTISKNQQKLNKLIQKDDLTNRDMRKLNKLIRKETKRKESPKPFEVKNNIKISKVSIKNDSNFWAKARPIELTKEEKLSFTKKDSLEKIIHKAIYKDSIRNEQRNFKLLHLVFGNIFIYKKNASRYRSYLETPGIIAITDFSFNTVDGIKIDLPFKYILKDTLGKTFKISNTLSPAFSRKTINLNSQLHYLFNGKKMSSITLEGGISSKDFKGNKYEYRKENSFYSLWKERNFAKYYLDKNISIKYTTEISNGITLSSSLKYAYRSPLKNNSDLHFKNYKNKEYSPNIPINDNIKTWMLEKSNNTSVALKLTYTPRQFYEYKKNIKRYLYSKYPTFSFSYIKAIDIGTISADYDFLEIGAKQNIPVGFMNSLKYNLKAGKYISSDKIFAQDLRYFKSLNENFTFSNETNKFRSLNYYEPISNNYFIEAHAKYSMSQFIIKRLPILNDLMMVQESLFFSYINNETLKNYFEVGYGLNNIYMLLNLEIITGFRKGKIDYFGIQLNFNLPQSNAISIGN